MAKVKTKQNKILTMQSIILGMGQLQCTLARKKLGINTDTLGNDIYQS
jgi:hypothetical protein